MDTPPEKLPVLRDDLIRLEHIAVACADIATVVIGRKREEFDSDMMLRRAVIHAIQEIGEASVKVTSVTRKLAPDVPWGSIVATRNMVVHVYWGVDLDRIWNVATTSIPILQTTIQAIITSAEAYEQD